MPGSRKPQPSIPDDPLGDFDLNSPLDLKFDPLGSLDVAGDLDNSNELDEEDSKPDPLAGVKYTGNPEVDAHAELAALQEAFEKKNLRENSRATAEKKRYDDMFDTEYWACFCFQSREQKEQFLRAAKLIILGDKYIDGIQAARILGHPVDPVPYTGAKPPRIDRRYAELAMKKGE